MLGGRKDTRRVVAREQIIIENWESTEGTQNSRLFTEIVFPCVDLQSGFLRYRGVVLTFGVADVAGHVAMEQAAAVL